MATPTTVNSTVFSLAGAGFRAPLVQPAATFSDPVPLGVRIYDHASSLDVWVTKWVDDLQYRSVIPGGFASASFRLHIPQHMYPAAAGWATRADRIPLVRLFNRVQIVDLRTSEIAWEGRIDSAARVTDDGFAWDIGCAGAMIAATDITRPVFYADSSLDWWLDNSDYAAAVYAYSRTDSGPALVTAFNSGDVWLPGSQFTATIHALCYATEQYLGRYSITYNSNPPSVTGGTGMVNRVSISSPSTNSTQIGVDETTLNAAQVRKSNPVGGTNSFASTVAQTIELSVANPGASTVTIPASNSGATSWINPVVIPQLMNRNGTLLTSSSNYPNDWVTVSQVVEDVLGRFLVGGWTFDATLNNPWPGSVRAADAYIDTSDTTHITDLKFENGATAADILNKLMTVQTNAYWAIWESKNTATNDPDAARFRFEWATWPASPGYMASSADGLDEQPDGSNVYNFVFYQSQRVDNAFTFIGTNVQEWWDFTDPSTAPLLAGRLTRAATVKKDGLTDSNTAANLATAWIAANGKEVNTGTLTVKRPIQLYDAGLNSNSGAGRMVDPAMIRPGKLIRIVDVPPQADITNFNHGSSAPPATHTGAVFKVVATNYDSTDNSCRLELDQITAWSLPGQIIPSTATNVQTIPG